MKINSMKQKKNPLSNQSESQNYKKVVYQEQQLKIFNQEQVRVSFCSDNIFLNIETQIWQYMNNHIGYQQIHNHPKTLQGYQVQQIQSQCQPLIPPNSARPNQLAFQTQNLMPINGQINNNVDTSPSSRFLSSTARVLKNQTIDFKQMIQKQPQQNRQIQNHNGIVQLQQPHHQQIAEIRSKSSSSSSQQPNQINYEFCANNYLMPNHSNNVQQSSMHVDYLPQYTNIQYKNDESKQINGGDYKGHCFGNQIAQFPIQDKNQQQNCMAYFINQNQPTKVEFIERRLSAPNHQREDNYKQGRFSVDIQYSYLDSLQSTVASYPKTEAISVISNYSPSQIENDILIKNTNEHIKNNPLKLDQSMNESEGNQLQNDHQKDNNLMFNKIQNNCKFNIDSVDQPKSDIIKQLNRNQQDEHISYDQQDNQSNSILSRQLINLYIQKGPDDEIEEGQQFVQLSGKKNQSERMIKIIDYKKEEELISSAKLQNQKSLENLKNNSCEQISSSKVISLLGNDQVFNLQNHKKLLNSSLQLSSKSQQSQNSISNRNNQNNQNAQQKKKGESITKLISGGSQLNQKKFFVDDRYITAPYTPKDSYQIQMDKNKVGQNRRYSQDEQNKNKTKSQKQEKNNAHEKIIQQNEQNTNSSPLFTKIGNQFNSIQVIQLDKQKPNKDQEQNNIGNSNTNKINKDKYHSLNNNQLQVGNLSGSRQITFPESPICEMNIGDFSYGFGSDITQNENNVYEQMRGKIQNQNENVIPLIATHSQVIQEFQQRQNIQKITQTEPNQQIQQNLFAKLSSKSENITSDLKNKEQQQSQKELEQRKKIENKLLDLIDTEKDADNQKLNYNDQRSDSEDEDQQADPNFINLYKNPLKHYSTNKNEITSQQHNTEIQAQGNLISQNKLSFYQNQEVIPSKTQMNPIKQEYPIRNSLTQNQNIQIQEYMNKQNNEILMNHQIQNNQGQQSLKFENNKQPFNDQNNGQQLNCNNQNINSLNDLSEEQDSSQSATADNINIQSKQNYKQYQYAPKRSSKFESESIQSINELLHCMGGLQPVSHIEFPLPTNHALSNKNLSLIFDENSVPPSKVCSLKNFNGYIDQNEQKANYVEQNLHNSPQKSTVKKEVSTNQINQKNSQKQFAKIKQILNQKSNMNSSKEKISRNSTQIRQQTPTKNLNNQQQQKINQQLVDTPQKNQNIIGGQLQTVKQQHSSINSQTENNSLSQKKLQKSANQKIQDRKYSLTNNKAQNVLSYSKNITYTQLNSQINNIQGENKISINKDSQTVLGITSNSKSQKDSLSKFDYKSINNGQNKSTTVFQNSSLQNYTISSTVNVNNFNKSNGSSLTNLNLCVTKTSEGGGNILVESILRNNEYDSQNYFPSQIDEKQKSQILSQKFQQNNSLVSNSSCSKKQECKRSSLDGVLYEDSQDQVEQYDLEEKNQIKEKPQSNMKFGSFFNQKLKNVMMIEEINQGSQKRDCILNLLGNQDTDRSMKSERQIKKMQEKQSKNISTLAYKKQSSLHEKNQKDVPVLINLEKGRNSLTNGQLTNLSTKSKIKPREQESSKSPNQNISIKKDETYFEYKTTSKQNVINLQSNGHYRRESYSSQKLKSNNEIKERPKSIQRGTLHNSIDNVIQDYIEDGDKCTNNEKKKMLTSNSPIIEQKRQKGQIINQGSPNKAAGQHFIFHSQTGSYTSNNHIKNQYYQSGNNKNTTYTTSDDTQNISSPYHIHQQSSQLKPSQKIQSNAYNSFSNLQQIQKIQSFKKEDILSSPQKVNYFDKMK